MTDDIADGPRDGSGADALLDVDQLTVTPSGQRAVSPGGAVTFTVVGADGLPWPPAEEYLQFLRLDGASPNTVRAYATALGLWLRFLIATGTAWDGLGPLTFGRFLAWLDSGDLPGTTRIGPPATWLAPSSVGLRSAAVLSFYRWHAAAHQLVGPYQLLYAGTGRRGRSRYRRWLAGIADHAPTESRAPTFRAPTGPRRRAPVLTPAQLRLILDSCGTQRDDGDWTGGGPGLRDRLLFALLTEAGMRLGEALSLRHGDIDLGRGGAPAVAVTPRQDHPHGARAKSGRPRRIVIGDDVAALYSAWVWWLVDHHADLLVTDLASHFVFVNATTAGPQFAPLRPETVYARVRAITRRHPDQLPAGWSPHWLRHTHATALLLSGCPAHVVMRRLGHADVQTTLDIYGWVTEDAELRAVADWRSFVAGWAGLFDAQP